MEPSNAPAIVPAPSCPRTAPDPNMTATRSALPSSSPITGRSQAGPRMRYANAVGSRLSGFSASSSGVSRA